MIGNANHDANRGFTIDDLNLMEYVDNIAEDDANYQPYTQINCNYVLSHVMPVLIRIQFISLYLLYNINN